MHIFLHTLDYVGGYINDLALILELIAQNVIAGIHVHFIEVIKLCNNPEHFYSL